MFTYNKVDHFLNEHKRWVMFFATLMVVSMIVYDQYDKNREEAKHDSYIKAVVEKYPDTVPTCLLTEECFIVVTDGEPFVVNNTDRPGLGTDKTLIKISIRLKDIK